MNNQDFRNPVNAANRLAVSVARSVITEMPKRHHTVAQTAAIAPVHDLPAEVLGTATMQRQGGRVKIDLSEDEFNEFLKMLGLFDSSGLPQTNTTIKRLQGERCLLKLTLVKESE